MENNEEFRHILRYGTHAEQSYFLGRFESHYDLIMFNAHIVAYTPAGIAAFLVGKTKGKKYIIDPITHAFAHSPSKIKVEKEDGTLELKASLKSLIHHFGDPVIKKAGKKSIIPDDFRDESITKDFTLKVLDFQENILNRCIQESEYSKYLEQTSVHPEVLIPPYFYMTAVSYKDWLPINKIFIQIAKEEKPAQKIFGEIVISQDMLPNRTILDNLISNYKDSGCDGIFIWIDGFSELTASKEDLDGFQYLLSGLANNIPIYNLYGSYYSIMLCKKGSLSGMCHGLHYGEDREVTPVGGGIPRAKFYLPGVHSRLRYGEVAHSIFENKWVSVSDYRKHICWCETCQEVIEDKVENFKKYGIEIRKITRSRSGQEMAFMILSSESKDRCIRHYLDNKKKEFEEIDLRNMTELKDDLIENFEKFKETLGIENVGHLKIWYDTL